MANAGTSRGKTTNNNNASDDIQMLATSMKGKLDKLHLLSPNCSIHEVPKKLRKINEAAFTPRRVSIGPLHHGKKGLKPAEEHKWRYLQDFLERSQKSTTLVDFLMFIKNWEERIRECYAEPITPSSNRFVEMILVDAAFVIQILLRYRFVHLRTETDRIFNKPWMDSDIEHDLFLLENQLPLFLLEELLEMANIKVDSSAIEDDFAYPNRIIYYCLIFFLDSGRIEFIDHIGTSEVEHLLDLLRSCYIPTKMSEVGQTQKESRNDIFPKTATELHEAGVKFKASSTKDLFHITFSVTDGVLQLAPIKIYDRTEPLLRNLLAFEQCHCVDSYMSDYVMFMDRLINTSKDVQLLVKCGIIENWLGNDEEVSNLYNKLCKNIGINSEEFYFTWVSNALNDYCKIRRHKWKATLMHNYFKTPWRGLSVVAAVILLLLTSIQTMCSIISVIK